MKMSERKYEVSGNCVFTGKLYTVYLTEQEFLNHLARQNGGGLMAQEAFPNLSAADREFLISGISPEGWALMSANMDEEFEEDI